MAQGERNIMAMLLEELHRAQDDVRAAQAAIEAYQNAGTVSRRSGHAKVAIMPKAYAGLKMWQAVREYLRAAPDGKAAVNELIDAMEKGGMDLGKYPLRTVVNTVKSPRVSQYFNVWSEGNDLMVALKDESAMQNTAHRTEFANVG